MKQYILSADYSGGSAGKARHYHDCHQILYITAGCAEIEVAGRHYTARAGTLVLISRFEQHSITVKSSPYRRFSLQISPEPPNSDEECAPLFSVLANRPSQFRHAVQAGGRADILSGIFERIVKEAEGGLDFASDIMNLLFKGLLAELYRICPELFFLPLGGGLDAVREIQSRFENDFARDYSLSALAEEYNFSVYYLCHLFKKITGYSVMEHLGSCRIAAAKKYLAETRMSIGEIVELCGFSNSSNFSRKFKEITGISPSEFRKKYR